MIRIAIVDDNKNDIQFCKEFILSLKLPNLDIIDCFKNGDIFLQEIISKNEHYDIVILDIDMPEINGFDVAQKINELDMDMIVIFNTAHEQYVFKAYEYQPFRYIRKEFFKEEMPFALQCAIDKIEKKSNKSIVIRTNKVDKKIAISNITFAESYKNYIEIFLDFGEKHITKITLTELWDMLSDSGFIYANKSIIVNLKYIREITAQSIIMNDGFEISISRRNYKAVKAAFAEYIGDLL